MESYTYLLSLLRYPLCRVREGELVFVLHKLQDLKLWWCISFLPEDVYNPGAIDDLRGLFLVSVSLFITCIRIANPYLVLSTPVYRSTYRDEGNQWQVSQQLKMRIADIYDMTEVKPETIPYVASQPW